MATILERVLELKIEDLEARVRELEQRCSDLDAERLFWKQAADNAVCGWEKQEDASVKLREQLVLACDAGLRVIGYAEGFVFDHTRRLFESLKAEARADDSPEDRETPEDTDASS